jgi:hypothetical protein
MCASMGDEWGAQHFTTQAPLLARNIVAISEHNPWLRAKLEQMAAGESVLANAMLIMVLGKSLIEYALPPIIYYANPPFISPKARALLNVPERGPQLDPEALRRMMEAQGVNEEELRAAAEAAAAAQAASQAA